MALAVRQPSFDISASVSILFVSSVVVNKILSFFLSLPASMLTCDHYHAALPLALCIRVCGRGDFNAGVNGP